MKTFTLAAILLVAVSAPVLAQGGADAAQLEAQVDAYGPAMPSSSPRIGAAREFSARAVTVAPIARPAGRALPIDLQAVPEVASPN
ncbi:MAG: hypothetical protein J0H01_24255 [Rhizobiales bacterium]|nr:hypothetical protein [Hyphomicrobiales bacterium]